jgi:hypothetical protein
MSKSFIQPTAKARSLGHLLNSAREITRKDNGRRNGNLCCPPIFTWITFLKFLHDLEH